MADESDDLELDKESITTIDKGRLDEEWVGQADKYLEYAEQLAEARHDALELAAAYEVAEAEAELDVRSKPKKYKLKQPIREAAIKLQVTLHPLVKKAKRRVNKAKYRVDLLDGAVKSLDHRKRALEKLVDLHGQGYFSKPHSKVKDEEEFTKGQPKRKHK